MSYRERTSADTPQCLYLVKTCIESLYLKLGAVLVFRATAPVRPLLGKTYTFSSSAVVGLYDNFSAAMDMFIAGFETTLP